MPFGFGDGSLTPQQLAAIQEIIDLANGRVVAEWRTAVVNFAALGTHAIDMPLRAGFRFAHLAVARIELHTRDAVLTTGLTFSLQQNGVDMPGATGLPTTAAVLNAITAPACVVSNPGSMFMADMTAFPIQFNITTPVAGVGLTSCTGRYVVIGYYTTVP